MEKLVTDLGKQDRFLVKLCLYVTFVAILYQVICGSHIEVKGIHKISSLDHITGCDLLLFSISITAYNMYGTHSHTYLNAWKSSDFLSSELRCTPDPKSPYLCEPYRICTVFGSFETTYFGVKIICL